MRSWNTSNGELSVHFLLRFLHEREGFGFVIFFVVCDCDLKTVQQNNNQKTKRTMLQQHQQSFGKRQRSEVDEVLDREEIEKESLQQRTSLMESRQIDESRFSSIYQVEPDFSFISQEEPDEVFPAPVQESFLHEEEEDEEISDFEREPSSQLTLTPILDENGDTIDVHYVTNLYQASIELAQRYASTNRRAALWARLKAYIKLDNIPAKSINFLFNACLESLNLPTCNPNLPQMMKTHLDHYLKGFLKPHFKVKAGGFKLHYYGQFRDVEEAVLNLIVSNSHLFAPPNLKSIPCASVSEFHQTPFFKQGVQKQKCEQVIGLTLYSDGSSLNNSFGDSIHPTEIGVISFGNSFKVAHPRRVTACVAFFSKPKECKVVDSSGNTIKWDSIPKSQRDKLSLRLKKKLVYFLQKQIQAMVEKVYFFPNGIGLCRFIFVHLLSDFPEKADWTSSIGCFTCDDDTILTTSEDGFRSQNNTGGRVHDEGPLAGKWASCVCSGDGNDAFSYPDIMVSVYLL